VPQTNDDLIDHALLASANARMAGASDCLKKTADDLASAKIMLNSAETAAAKAPGIENEIVLEKAQRAVRVAEKSHAAAVANHTIIETWLALAKGIAHSQLFLAGLRRRVDAAMKADAARAMLAAAETEMRAATAMCRQAYAAGHPDIFGLCNRPISVALTAADEIAAIEAQGVDLETGTYSWLTYAKSAEPKEI
jgi:hypothetical protein